MSQSATRRDFLRVTGTLGVAACLPTLSKETRAASAARKAAFPNAAKLGWSVGASQYTFRRFTLYEALPMIASLGFQEVEPAFFLKLDKRRPALKVDESLSAEDRKQLKMRLADNGIRMDSYYTSLTGDRDACMATFDFAAQMGAKTLVAEPPVESLDMIEKLCDQYAINLAIHNHPKPRSKYWDPNTVVDACKGRSARIGGCSDVGHWARTGLDVVECLKKMQGRIIEVHLKDILEFGKPDSQDVPIGAGKARVADVLRELHRQKFKGLLLIEYEHDSSQLMQDMAQCAAFIEKTAQEIGG